MHQRRRASLLGGVRGPWCAPEVSPEILPSTSFCRARGFAFVICKWAPIRFMVDSAAGKWDVTVRCRCHGNGGECDRNVTVRASKAGPSAVVRTADGDERVEKPEESGWNQTHRPAGGPPCTLTLSNERISVAIRNS